MCGKAITGFATGSWTAPEPRARESRPPRLYRERAQPKELSSAVGPSVRPKVKSLLLTLPSASVSVNCSGVICLSRRPTAPRRTVAATLSRFRLGLCRRHAFGIVEEVPRQDPETFFIPDDLNEAYSSRFLSQFHHAAYRYVHDCGDTRCAALTRNDRVLHTVDHHRRGLRRVKMNDVRRPFEYVHMERPSRGGWVSVSQNG